MNFKNLTLSITLGLTLLVGSIQQSNAAAIAIVSSPYGLLIAAGAGAFAFSSATAAITKSKNLGFLLNVGLLILDKESQSIKFTEISEEQAKLLNISLEEREIFNQEVNRVNATSEELNSLIEELKKSGKDENEIKQEVEFKTNKELSPETVSTLKKLLNSIVLDK